MKVNQKTGLFTEKGSSYKYNEKDNNAKKKRVKLSKIACLARRSKVRHTDTPHTRVRACSFFRGGGGPGGEKGAEKL